MLTEKGRVGKVIQPIARNNFVHTIFSSKYFEPSLKIYSYDLWIRIECVGNVSESGKGGYILRGGSCSIPWCFRLHFAIMMEGSILAWKIIMLMKLGATRKIVGTIPIHFISYSHSQLSQVWLWNHFSQSFVDEKGLPNLSLSTKLMKFICDYNWWNKLHQTCCIFCDVTGNMSIEHISPKKWFNSQRFQILATHMRKWKEWSMCNSRMRRVDKPSQCLPLFLLIFLEKKFIKISWWSWNKKRGWWKWCFY